uniref:Apolipoprotein L domain containing 1 n=1 Tax=Nothobranchius furzeri TaxID=105023 RepID=A0A1A7Z7Z3_NOTFU
MRGEAAVGDGVEEDERGGDSVKEKRASVAMLKSMLENNSRSPLFNPYINGVQDVLLSNQQNGAPGTSTGANPFHSYYMESGSLGHIRESSGSKSEAANTIILPPPDYQDTETTLDHSATARDDFHDRNINPLGFISRNASRKQNLSKPWEKNGFHSVKDELQDLFYANKGEEFLRTDHPNEMATLEKSCDIFVDPFKAQLEKENDLFQASQTVPGNPFHKSKTAEADLFQSVPAKTEDLFAVKRKEDTQNSVDNYSFRKAKEKNAFDLFFTPSEVKLGTPPPTDLQRTPLKLPPAVPPKPPNKPRDRLQPTSFIQAAGLSPSPSQSQTEITNGSNFKRPPRPLPRIRRHRSEISPQPEKPTLLEKTITSESPPQPERPQEPERPQQPERPPQSETPLKPEGLPQPEVSVNPITQIEPEPDALTPPPKSFFKLPTKPPKPSFRLKSKTPETKLVTPDNYVVFEDILLIGQEQCVEDWPEDSPEVDPDFKPSGKIKLRRDSMLDSSETNASAGEHEDDVLGPMEHKKEKNTKVSNLFRRSSLGAEGKTIGHLKDGDTHKKHIGKRNTHRKPSEDEPRGAHGYTPHKGSKEKSLDEDFGAYGHTPQDKSKNEMFDNEDAMNELHPQSAAKGDVMGEKKKKKQKLPSIARQRSKENMLDDNGLQKKKKSSSSAEELDNGELHEMEKASKQKAQHPVPRKPRAARGLAKGGLNEDHVSKKNAASLGEAYDVDVDYLDLCKPKNTFKQKVAKKLKAKHKAKPDAAPGAAPADLSEAAKAEWMAAQNDLGLDEEDFEEDGDTDSLMEWWCTVEQWDELPSDEEEAAIKEDESKSFTILAGKVERGLRVFNKVFTERAEVLWESILQLHFLADDISEFHQKARIAGITGGTTTAVGSVAAITGLALAPLTFGASLVVTAVGVGVAAAGGITSASAAISDNVHNMNDRKKVEALLKEYEEHMMAISKILHFLNQGLYKLRGHPFLRSGTQHYSQDWEIRKAVQVIGLVDSPVMRATSITDDAVASLQGLFQGMDKYFAKDSRELKKGCKKEIVAEIRQVANVLNDCIVELNAIREDLQKATGL